MTTSRSLRWTWPSTESLPRYIAMGSFHWHWKVICFSEVVYKLWTRKMCNSRARCTTLGITRFLDFVHRPVF
jgi:hypothetical protein